MSAQLMALAQTDHASLLTSLAGDPAGEVKKACPPSQQPASSKKEAVGQERGGGGYPVRQEDSGKAHCGHGAQPAACADSLENLQWPSHYKRIPRVNFKAGKLQETLEELHGYAKRGEPVIFQSANLMDTKKWADRRYLPKLLGGRKVTVKRSPNHRFRYFDMKKNIGNLSFQAPLAESNMSYDDFEAEVERILSTGSSERLYMQETLSGHEEMAEEFSTWNWEFLIKSSTKNAWGLPDTNELFVGMRDCETPLHFDERENLLFQVRGTKHICVYPFVEYSRMYPFPTVHPCDRQSMVCVRNPDPMSFPDFQGATGHYETLQAGDMFYLPYGWWHWLKNVDDYAISVSFWSTTPPTDLKDGIPEFFDAHMLTRVRRNLESMIAQRFGPEKLNETMMGILKEVPAPYGEGGEGKEEGEILKEVRSILTAVKIKDIEDQNKFLHSIIRHRFGIDWQRWV